AAKLGRPVLNQALKLLRNGKAQGIILHKLDRGARNLRDWAAIGELSDQGIEVHFVTESIDPVMGPLVRRAFELYGTAQYNLESLGKELYRLGLRSKSGREVKISSLSVVLNNPFYIGLIRIQKTNETFVGIHEPSIGKTLFDRVQAVLTGKTNTRSHKHDYPYRRM